MNITIAMIPTEGANIMELGVFYAKAISQRVVVVNEIDLLTSRRADDVFVSKVKQRQPGRTPELMCDAHSNDKQRAPTQ